MADIAPTPSSSSLTSPTPVNRSLALSDQDESVMIAVRALDDMRSRAIPSTARFSPYPLNTSAQPTPALSTTSTATSPSIASHNVLPDDTTSPDFVSRVSGFPLVTTALRAYEQSKASSRVVKYGAEMMESSVKTISRPVIDRLPVNQLDEFACRQLDRLGRYGKPGQDNTSPERRRRDSSVERGRPSWNQGLQTRDQSFSVSAATSREPSICRSDAELENHEEDRLREQHQQEAAARSRWQALLLEAGGIGAAVSEESMRKLKYCLQWLQYATEHIDAQILVLRNFIASLSSHGDNTEEQYVSASHLQTLTDVKRDVVDTIRQVVDVVSKYAGGALPEPARASVRQFILHLPQRWASTAHRQGARDNVDEQTHSRYYNDSGNRPVSGPAQPPLLPNGDAENGILPPMAVLPPPEQVRAGVRPTAIAATQAAQRILTLATESLDMMRSVTGVFKESLDRAEAWIERLRIIGIQRQHQRQRVANGDDAEDPLTAPTGTFAYQPPPRESSWPYSAPSPTGMTATSLGALSLSSTYETPKSSLSSLSCDSDDDSDWNYKNGRGRSTRELDHAEEERAGISGIRGTVERTITGMDVDDE